MCACLRCVTTVFIAMILANALTGCLSVKVRMGNKPDIEALQQSLTIGESTRDDVRQAIGKPAGTGRAKLPMQPAPVDMWNYYYVEGTMDDGRMLLLFVYFDKDVYQGYLWWSSFDE